jgi:hypothetical protein
VTEIPFVAEPDATPGDAPLQYELPRAGRVRLTVRAGERRTGGHSIAVTHVRRDGNRVTVHCVISEPASDAIVTQVLTTPMQTVSIDERVVRGIREVVLVDASGTERGRISFDSRLRPA